MLDVTLTTLTSPVVLFFILGLIAALARSELVVPEAAAKFVALYLLLSIGYRGGAEVAHAGLTARVALTLSAGIALSAAMPFLAYGLLRRLTIFRPIDAAAIAAHYGSISIVTFLAMTSVLGQFAIAYEGTMVAVAAAMETPAIFAGLWLARRADPQTSSAPPLGVLREIALNGSIVVLIGAFAIGALTGGKGMATLKPFLVDVFPGFLCLFLLDMGLVAGRGLREGWRSLRPGAVVFAILMPLIGAALALPLALVIGLSLGSTAILMTLAASASYIAVPAALRIALPQANPALSLTLSLCLTFPFNVVIGIPLYLTIARYVVGE